MGLGIPELIVILFIIILIFGASRLPEIGRGLGKGIRNFKDATRSGRKTEPPTAGRGSARLAASHVPGPGTPAEGSHTCATGRSAP